MKSKVVLCLSGGLDSTALLYELRSQDREVSSITFDYGQRHRREIEAAHAVARAAGVSCETVDLAGFGRHLRGSALTDPGVPVPHGHYCDESMKQTVVPNRNMIFLSLAAGYAIAQRAEAIAFAAHAGDHAIYPDCRAEFVEALRKTLILADWHKVQLLTPFLHFSKSDICRRGSALEAPFHLTWSCYEGGEVHCGRCGTCVERKEAFEMAGVRDPTAYK